MANFPGKVSVEHPTRVETLTVVIPCFNEQETVEATVEDVLKTAPGLPLNLEIILIDDGSSDQTRSIMEGVCNDNEECRMIVNPVNVGLGTSILNVYKEIEDGSWVTVVPGDDEIIFQSINNYIQVRDDYDVILGYLHNPVIRTLSRRLASYLFSKTVNVLYGFPYRYLNGLKMYRVEVFRDIEVSSGGHAFNAELLAKALLRNPFLRIGEVPFSARGRVSGSSKAVRLNSVSRACREVVTGYRSVTEFRKKTIQGA